MIAFILFISLFLVALVVFFAFYPIKAEWQRHAKTPRVSKKHIDEEIFDDDEL